ncbi:MAG: hypothetical protein NC226_07345 [Bacteroides cellulosilyticus]|nr:hypothetical protein [Bacteroides cellulosilyticus]
MSIYEISGKSLAALIVVSLFAGMIGGLACAVLSLASVGGSTRLCAVSSDFAFGGPDHRPVSGNLLLGCRFASSSPTLR